MVNVRFVFGDLSDDGNEITANISPCNSIFIQCGQLKDDYYFGSVLLDIETAKAFRDELTILIRKTECDGE
jgi:hypothetical protein